MVRDRRLLKCVTRWPECDEGKYDPRCCRFPKSCSCTVYDPALVSEADLEPEVPEVTEESVRPDFRGFADRLRAEAKWSALIHQDDTTGQAASDQRSLHELADRVEAVGKRLGFW